MKNFIYLLGAGAAPEAVVIDPAWDADGIFRALEADQKKLAGVVLTHHHFDHLNAVDDVLARADVPVYAQRSEIAFAGVLADFKGALRPMGPGDRVQVGPLELTLVHTPGHTPGSQCVHCGGALFAGDTVFVNACGRCDLPGGDPEQMFDSLQRVLGALPDATVVYPGHDYGDVPTSSLARERAHNPYFQLSALEGFVSHRMRPRG